MGAEGGLPGGEPIVYFAAGNKVENLDEEITPEETPSGLSVDYRSAVETFVNQFNMAFQEEDVGILYGLLDPAVIDLYGADVCKAYLSTVIKNTTQLELLEVLNVGAWIWEIDGLSIQLSNIYKAIVNFTVQGNTTQESFHLSLAEDGSMRWFTDCGDPQAQ